MTDDNFLNAFKSLKSEEDNTDCFCVAGVKRKILVLNYYGLLKMKNCPQTMEFVVNEDFDTYAEVIDNNDSEKVNNYVEYVFSVLSNFQNDERHKWKSELCSLNLKSHFEPLFCSNGLNCRNDIMPLDSSKVLKQSFLQYKEVNESEISKVHSVSNVKIYSRDIPLESNGNLEKNIQCNKEISKNIESCFQTARNELEIQNSKKFGKNSIPNEKYCQGQVKKTLGARKGGVFSKFQPPLRNNESMENHNKVDIDNPFEEKLKNIDPAMVELIKNEIMDSGSKITWDDIAGLNLAKNTIQEIVVWPMLRPDIFTGLRRPPKGILLFGPPGTGKTLIGKCIASQSNSTFFSISASSLTSKWVGDGEKMVRTLFAVAKVYQPSVIFIDEIDSLLTQRSDSDHECSRRIKTEFLVQLDGAGTGDEDRILIIGATNRPQELDEAARRRLVKRLYIPLPDEEARKQIIQNLISTERHCLTESEIKNVAKMTKGYSGADVKNLCQEASLGPIRSIAPHMIQSINPEDVRAVTIKDFESALCRIKSSVSEKDLDIYSSWDKQYGCGRVNERERSAPSALLLRVAMQGLRNQYGSF